jgi:glycosyltransferase involved in cell wall biosynthesis
MHSVLSYFDAYFKPAVAAPLSNHSAGQIARHLYDLLSGFGTVTYLDAEERPTGLEADLFVGHFWNYLEVTRRNSFKKKVAFYTISDPDRRYALLRSVAERFGVPLPVWDFPPPHFDHSGTMDDADMILLVGNFYTLDTFPAKWRHKIRLLNYSVDAALYQDHLGTLTQNETSQSAVCYVATQCGLRKGFMDVLRTWTGIDSRVAQLHVIGRTEPPWDRLLQHYNNGSMVYHGWIDSHSPRYASILQRSRFVYIPTYEEGQMGSLLEAMHCGCVPITTRASGIDDRLLQLSLVIEPFNIDQQRAAILHALSWPEEFYRARQAAVATSLKRFHNWRVFETGVESALAELL